MVTAVDSIGAQDGTYVGTWCGAVGLVSGTDLAAESENIGTDKIDLPASAFPVLPAHDWSIVALVKLGIAAPTIAYFAWNVGFVFVWFGFFDANQLGLAVHDLSALGELGIVEGATTIALGTTHLCVGTFENATDTFSLYVDGVLDGSGVNTNHNFGSATTPNFAAIGAVDAGVAAGQSTFDEMAMYDVCLSAGDVAALQTARTSYAAFNTAVIGAGATNFYHLGEVAPCVAPIVNSWQVGRIGVG